jgi:hypothetical protein
MSAGNILSSLIVPIVGDISGLNKAFTQVTTKAEQFGKAVGKKMDPMRAGLNSIGSAALKVVAPIAAAATAFAGFASIMEAFERNESLGKMSAALGITVENLSKLHYVSKMNSGSAEGMNASLMKMEKFLNDAATGSAEAQAKLARMGLTVRDLAGLKPEEAFGKLADGMNTVTDQGAKMDLMLTVFGKNSKDVVGTVKLGSKGIKEMGDEGAALGRTMKALDFGKIAEAKGSIEKMQTAFQSLADRVTIALAPLFDWIANAINNWIGNTEQFDSVFQGVAKGIVVAIAVIRTAWNGLLLLWDMAKVAFAQLGLWFLQATDKIVYALKWIGKMASNQWDWICASFDVTKNLLVVAWRWVADQVIGIIGGIGIVFGEQMRDMGTAMGKSGVKGLSDAGWALASAGGDLIVGASRMRSGSEQALKAAKDNLDKSQVALEDSWANMNNSDGLKSGFEDQVHQAQVFKDEMVETFTKLAQELADMEGGNPFADTMASWDRQLEAFKIRSAKSTEEGKKEIAVINESFAAQEEATEQEGYDRRGMALAEHFNNLLLSTQAAQEELGIIQSDNEALQWARQEEFNAQRELSEQKAIDAQVMLWESGAMGKMAAIGGVLNNLASLMQSKNKSLFMIGKVAAMAQNVIDTIASAASSYAWGSKIGGPIVGGAFAATAVLAGVVRAQQLMAAQPSGGSIGGGSSGGGGASSAGAASAQNQAGQAENRNVNVTLYGDNFSGSQVRGLIGAINEQIGDNMSLKAQVAR